MNLSESISLVIRRAREDEAQSIARLYRRTAEHAWDFLCPHTPEEDLAYFTHALQRGPVWVAAREATILGFCATRRGWIDHFYVAPEEQGRGIGQRLIGQTLRGRRHVRLWTFQRNARSRAFYAQQGFEVARMTDGRDNEEREPDVLLEWRRRP